MSDCLRSATENSALSEISQCCCLLTEQQSNLSETDARWLTACRRHRPESKTARKSARGGCLPER
jgi:hypothetical protein